MSRSAKTLPLLGEQVKTITEPPKGVTYAQHAQEVADRWVELAQIMSDAFGAAFDELGTDIGRLANQATQLYAMFQKMKAEGLTGGAIGGGIEGAIAGAGFGSALGGMINKGYSQEFGALGGAIGGTWGAAIGTFVGSFIKKGTDEAVATLKVEGGKIVSEITGDSSELRDAMKGITGEIIDSIQGLLDDLGGALESADFSIKIRDDTFIVFVNGLRAEFEKAEDAINFALAEVLSSATFTGMSEEIAAAVQRAAEQAIIETVRHYGEGGRIAVSTFETDIKQLQEDLAFIKTYERSGMSNIQAALTDLTRNFEDASERATRLGLDVGRLTEEYESQTQAIKDAALLDFGADLVGFVEDYYGNVKVNEEFRRNLEAVNFGIRLAQLQLEYQALLAVNAITAELAAQAQALIDFALANPPDFGREQNAANRAAREAEREARQDFRSELKLLEETFAGVSDGVVSFHRDLQDLEAWLEEQAAAGVSKTNIDRFRRLTLQGWLDDIMAPVMDVVADLSDADQIRAQYADIREQVIAIAAELGIAVEPFLAFIAAAEAADIAALDADKLKEMAAAEKELAAARKAGLQALKDMTRPEYERRLQAIYDAIAAAAGAVSFTPGAGGVFGAGAAGVLPPEILNAGQAAVSALGRDFLNSLVSMGIKIPGVTEAILEFQRAQTILTITTLAAAGAFEGFSFTAQDLIDKTNEYFDAQIKGVGAVTEASKELQEALEAQADRLKAAKEKFADMWDAITAVADKDPTARVRKQFADLRQAFIEMSFPDKKAFLQSQGFDIGLFTKFEEIMKRFDLAVADELAAAIAEATADALEDALDPIRDYFDELRTSRAGLTTGQQFTATLDQFNEAIAAGDITKALQFARMLTGDVGVAQFGSSTEAFQDLVDYVVLRLGGQLPEGPPEDLLQQTIEDGVDIERASNETLSRLLEAQLRSEERADARNRDLIAALDAYQQAGRVN